MYRLNDTASECQKLYITNTTISNINLDLFTTYGTITGNRGYIMEYPKIASKLPNTYNPLKDSVYMSPNMLLYFKQKLESMRSNQSIIEELHYNNLLHHAYEYLLRKEIDHALARIERGTYGYCEKTGQPIGVECLMRSPEEKYALEEQDF